MEKNNNLKKGLGIGALLSGINPEIVEQKKELTQKLSNTINYIPLIDIEVNPFQPRSEFDQEALQDLSLSIRTHGLIQPITVRHLGGGKYQLISGERRLRASHLANLEEIPAFVRLANDEEMLEMALIENIQRQDLNPIEIAITYKRLMEEFKLTQEELAPRVGKKRETISNYLRLLRLPEMIITGVQKGQITMGHAKALINLGDIALQISLFKEIIEKGLSVRQVEQLAQTYKQQPNTALAEKKIPFAHQMVQQQLTQLFNSKVQIKSNPNSGKGQIIVHFETDEDLKRLFEIIEKD